MEKIYLRLQQLLEKIQTKYKVIFLVFKIAVTGFFVIYIISRVNFLEFIEFFSGFNTFFLLLTILITFIATIFYNLRYSCILSSFNKHIPFWSLYLINRFSNLINFFLPGGIGQEIGRLAYLDDKIKIITSSLIDRFVGLLSLLILLLVSLCFIKVKLIYVFLISAATLVSLLCYWFLRLRFKSKLDASLLWSLAYTLLLVLISFFQFKTVGIDIEFFHLLFLVPLLSIALTIPISVQGYGLREFFWFTVLVLSAEKVLAYTILGYFINLSFSLPGLIIFIREKKKIISSDTSNN